MFCCTEPVELYVYFLITFYYYYYYFKKTLNILLNPFRENASSKG